MEDFVTFVVFRHNRGGFERLHKRRSSWSITKENQSHNTTSHTLINHTTSSNIPLTQTNALLDYFFTFYHGIFFSFIIIIVVSCLGLIFVLYKYRPGRPPLSCFVVVICNKKTTWNLFAVSQIHTFVNGDCMLLKIRRPSCSGSRSNWQRKLFFRLLTTQP